MAKSKSGQEILNTVRPARVNIVYKVHTPNAIETKELPFVLGVLADLSGNSTVRSKRLKDRKFVEIDRDNFDNVMKGMEPRATFQVQNTLSDEGGRFAVDLAFRSLDDFRPESVVAQVAPLRKLLEARTKLADLRNKLAGNDKLEDILNEVLNNTEKLAELGQISPRKD